MANKTIKIGDNSNNRYELIPAASRSHYGQHRESSGGEPYAYRAKKADEAWLVRQTSTGKVVGVLEKAYQEWGFQKIRGHGQAPQWLRSSMHGATDSTIYNLDKRIYSGPTADAAIAIALGIRVTAKTPAELDREIAELRNR